VGGGDQPPFGERGGASSSLKLIDAPVVLGLCEHWLDHLICSDGPEVYATPTAQSDSPVSFDTLTAAGLCAEVGDFRRFAKPALLSGFLG
jgi:hypothetical protein